MVKKKKTPVGAGKGQPTVSSYYAIVGKSSGNKNKEKPLKNGKSHYYRQETMKATTMKVKTMTVLFEQRKKLLLNLTRQQRMKEMV